MSDLFAGLTGEQLTRDAYESEFREHFWRINDHGFWKLERQQWFKEPGNGSWEAFAAGDWRRSMDILAAQVDTIKADRQKVIDHGFVPHRVRVVEQPVTPYLHWELVVLCMRAKHGERIRVVGAEEIRSLDADEQAPEIVVLGNRVMYRVLYDEDGVSAGAIRFTDQDLITWWRETISGLYEVGEDLDTFFEREIAPLDPPIAQG
ncbi:DUF6879 family protein [Rhizohabitans arisaemae]|uniref:DUF6879 family protein n=1 Tax=Rhizohabitans arisaemae TaxID=2720610 RepID=UPI0024B0936F|nr:DUF6879 family protein [Rhizohabitans arisaemae]